MQQPTFASVTKWEISGVLRETPILSLVLCKPAMLSEGWCQGSSKGEGGMTEGPWCQACSPADLPNPPYESL